MLYAAVPIGMVHSRQRVTGKLIRWNRRRTNWWVALVLPGLLLRALIPLGFMPMFGTDFSVQLTLCEGYAPVPASMDMSMDMPMDGKGGVPSHQDHSSCPYGASPTLASLPALSAVAQSVQLSATPTLSSPQVTYFELSPRAQSPRGPPLQV
jgi:hypothetical protein